MARFLVTGAAGFIGSNLVEALLDRGERVRGLDNLHSGKEENLRGLDGAEFRREDIRDMETCRGACAGIDYVLHHAALSSVEQSVKDPVLCNETNITGTLNLLLAARDAGVKRFVFAASSAAYGDTATLPLVETLLPRPLSPYAVSKVTGEDYCRIFTSLWSLETVSLRYFNVFGKRQDPASQYGAVIPRFVSALLQGRSPAIHGDGEQSRDFTYIADVVEANLKACSAPREACAQVYNIARGEQFTVNELYREIARLLGSDVRPTHEPPRQGDVRHSLADITLARERLGFAPRYSMRQGLAESIEWYRDHLRP